jgi:hypothetical protein
MLRDDDFNGSKIKVVKIDRIDIPDYQRIAMGPWAKTIAENWNRHLFTHPRLAEKPDGRYDCIDGQHELLAATLRGHESLPCIVFDGVGHIEAAAIFSDMNTGRKRLTPFDVYRADLIAGRQWAVDLAHIVDELGLRIARGASPHTVQAVGQCKVLIQDGRYQDLYEALIILVSAFDASLPENHDRLERKMIVGMADFVRRARRAEVLDIEKFGRKLSKVTYRRRSITGIRLTPESLERDYIPKLIEDGTLEMPQLNSAQGNAVLYGRAIAIAVLGVDQARALYA